MHQPVLIACIPYGSQSLPGMASERTEPEITPESHPPWCGPTLCKKNVHHKVDNHMYTISYLTVLRALSWLCLWKCTLCHRLNPGWPCSKPYKIYYFPVLNIYFESHFWNIFSFLQNTKWIFRLKSS